MSFKNTLLLFSVLLAGCVLPPKESAHPAAARQHARRFDRRGGGTDCLTAGGNPSTIRSSTA